MYGKYLLGLSHLPQLHVPGLLRPVAPVGPEGVGAAGEVMAHGPPGRSHPPVRGEDEGNSVANVVELPETGGDPQGGEEGHRQPDDGGGGEIHDGIGHPHRLPPSGLQLLPAKLVLHQTVLHTITIIQHVC